MPNFLFPLFAIFISLMALYLTLILIRADQAYGEVLKRLQNAKLKAAAAGDTAEVSRLDYILHLLTSKEAQS